MNNRFLLPFLLLLVHLPGCELNERQSAIEKREQELNQKEQELLLWQKDLQLKEDSLKLMIALRDSASLNDSTSVVPQEILGMWTTKMVCTQSSCSGSVLGDTKVEQWLISAQNKIVIVQAMNNKMQISRIYTGTMNENGQISLQTSRIDLNSPDNKMTTINVLLEKKGDNTMEGQREIIQADNCRVVYSLGLKKQN